MIGLELIAKLKEIEFKDIANYLDVSPQSVSDWIKGKRKVPSKRAKQLSKLFNISEELVGKVLTEDEELKLHYELRKFNVINFVQGMKEYGVGIMDIEQIQFDLGNEFLKERDTYTTSELEDKIKEERRKIKIKEADIMISQLKEMYQVRGAIDVHPEFQRVFRWSEKQKSRFIESILLGIPIPPIFVAEDENLNWDVIDGVQRLSTIFEFLGILKDDEKELLEPTVLVGTNVMSELDGKVWNNEIHQHRFSFNQSKYLTNAFLNATLKVIKVDSESDPKVKYDTFDRLNTGGSRLTNQEIRNCLAIMLNKYFYSWLRGLSYNPDFKTCMPLTETAMKEQDDLEYVLRFIVYRNIELSELSSSDDIGDVLTEKMRKFCSESVLDYNKEKEIFDKTFDLLAKALGEDSFKKYYKDGRFKGSVNLSNFEIIAIGIANNLESILALEDPIKHLKNKIRALYTDSVYISLQDKNIASQRAVTRLSKLTKFGTEYFRN
ncbi:DUF262 domain-containing protein [Clostridium estertheticum]|uniref:GmrSD restriction endonuclease domain-containing protein n=1 Tax=Clostridium estertheticum TaxID=238834 RepID=UPI001CF5820C|nr:DUF262 domain-containing protein [Clostridium estertheticum]MCB2305615.1 DUF262 domain-containing protein [Clostridium estertheticum]MCB2344569.1 DUF262 domain-containing protein [Clostridium estertheticum]MCB2347971.1 DUF262 domain-containing protein [Clostridium estertheticum]WAG45615.1 DUF262 domain-containing protein [Clostridium estertheticum]